MRPKQKPNLFSFHDYREFLKAWFAYKKKTDPTFTTAQFAKSAHLSPALLSLILNAKRPLTQKTLDQLLPELHLQDREASYFKNLVLMSDGHTEEERHSAFRKIQKYKEYIRSNPLEKEAYEYLSQWFFVAIRELAAMEGFKTDLDWLRDRLCLPITQQQAKEAVDFLFQHKLLFEDENGRIRRTQKDVKCVGGVWRLALTKFHREMLKLSTEVFERIPRPIRSITSYTLPLPANRFEEVRAILDEARTKIAALETPLDQPSHVFHVSLAAVPIAAIRPFSEIESESADPDSSESFKDK